MISRLFCAQLPCMRSPKFFFSLELHFVMQFCFSQLCKRRVRESTQQQHSRKNSRAGEVLLQRASFLVCIVSRSKTAACVRFLCVRPPSIVPSAANGESNLTKRELEHKSFKASNTTHANDTLFHANNLPTYPELTTPR